MNWHNDAILQSVNDDSSQPWRTLSIQERWIYIKRDQGTLGFTNRWLPICHLGLEDCSREGTFKMSTSWGEGDHLLGRLIRVIPLHTRQKTKRVTRSKYTCVILTSFYQLLRSHILEITGHVTGHQKLYCIFRTPIVPFQIYIYPIEVHLTLHWFVFLFFLNYTYFLFNFL